MSITHNRDHFTIVCHATVSSISEFSVRLPHEVNLSDRWEVAMSNFSSPGRFTMYGDCKIIINHEVLHIDPFDYNKDDTLAMVL
jgi:hypothetical protein